MNLYKQYDIPYESTISYHYQKEIPGGFLQLDDVEKNENKENARSKRQRIIIVSPLKA